MCFVRVCFMCVSGAKSKMTCCGNGSVAPQGLGLARDYCAGICFPFSVYLPLFLSLHLTHFSLRYPGFSISSYWMLFSSPIHLVSLCHPDVCLSNDRELLHTVIHEAVAVNANHCPPSLFGSFLVEIISDSRFRLYHRCTVL